MVGEGGKKEVGEGRRRRERKGRRKGRMKMGEGSMGEEQVT